jgi:hypothetical protein
MIQAFLYVGLDVNPSLLFSHRTAHSRAKGAHEESEDKEKPSNPIKLAGLLGMEAAGIEPAAR